MKKFAAALAFCLLLPSLWAQNKPYYVDLFDFSALKKDATVPTAFEVPSEPLAESAKDASPSSNQSLTMQEEENSPLGYFSSINVPESYQVYNHPFYQLITERNKVATNEDQLRIELFKKAFFRLRADLALDNFFRFSTNLYQPMMLAAVEREFFYYRSCDVFLCENLKLDVLYEPATNLMVARLQNKDQVLYLKNMTNTEKKLMESLAELVL